MADLYSVFHDALEKLAAGEADAVRKLMGSPYKRAYAGADDATRRVAKQLHEQIHNALKPEAENHIAPYAQQALAELRANDGFGKAAHYLHDAIHHIDHARAEQAAALTAQEAKLYEEKGALGYTASLVRRRWANTPGASAEGSPKLLEHQHQQQHTAQTAAKEEALLGMEALEEYAGIRHLNTTGRKLAVGTGATAGLGLIVHGGYNTTKALRGQKHEDSAAHPAAKEQEGTNWMRLVVGIGEMAAGAAIAYRMLTGRWGLRGPVKGMADPIMECGHGHGH